MHLCVGNAIELPPGLSIGNGGSSIETTPREAGKFIVTVSVGDADGDDDKVELILMVRAGQAGSDDVDAGMGGNNGGQGDDGAPQRR